MAANSRFAMATHILLAIALEQDQKPDGEKNTRVNSQRVAGSVNTNPVVVRRIVSDLTKAKMITSFAGKGGGLVLTRPPQQISLQEIYEALGEQPVFAYNPNKPNPKCPLSKKMAQVLRPVFADVQLGVSNQLAKIKLSDLKKKFA